MRILLSVMFLFGMLSCLGQDSIAIVRPGHYSMNGMKIKPKRISELMGDSESGLIWQSSNTAMGIANVCSFAGGFGLGWTLSTLFVPAREYSIERKNLNIGMMVVGIAGIASSIPFSIVANKRRVRAIGVYNESLKSQVGGKPSSYWEVSPGPVGINLSYKF